MGCIFKRRRRRKDGTIAEGRRWWIKYSVNGRIVREPTKFTNQYHARELLKLREGDSARGVPVDLLVVGKITFQTAAEALLTEYSNNERKSAGQVKRRIDLHLTPYFGTTRLTVITTAELESYIAHRRSEGAAKASINRELAILKRAFSLAIRAGKLLHRPYFPMLREDNVRVGFFEHDQYISVRDHLPKYLRPVVTFAYLTGWRIHSEVLPLEWRQVDLQRGEVRLDPGQTKNRHGRVLPYGDALPVWPIC